MRITRFQSENGQTQYGIDRGDGSAELLDGAPFQTPPRPTGRSARIARRLAPLEPTNIFCIGLNYRAHAEETNATLPDHPIVFMKPTSALTHPDDPIVIPASSVDGNEVDYECELAVVIGKPARDVSEADALKYVFGYTCGNDVSARKWQRHGGGGQWVRGKSFDTFCPLGPVLVTADEIPDPQALAISTTLNGRKVQSSTTADMIFPVAKLIAFLSQDTTLLPGTVILTGTPSGVGMGKNPPEFMKDGDSVTIEIERIGSITNPVKQAKARR